MSEGNPEAVYGDYSIGDGLEAYTDFLISQSEYGRLIEAGVDMDGVFDEVADSEALLARTEMLLAGSAMAQMADEDSGRQLMAA